MEIVYGLLEVQQQQVEGGGRSRATTQFADTVHRRFNILKSPTIKIEPVKIRGYFDFLTLSETLRPRTFAATMISLQNEDAPAVTLNPLRNQVLHCTYKNMNDIHELPTAKAVLLNTKPYLCFLLHHIVFLLGFLSFIMA